MEVYVLILRVQATLVQTQMEGISTLVHELARRPPPTSWLNARPERRSAIAQVRQSGWLARRYAWSTCSTTAQLLFHTLRLSGVVSDQPDTLANCYAHLCATYSLQPRLDRMLVLVSIRPVPWVSFHDLIIDLSAVSDTAYVYESYAACHSLLEHLQRRKWKFSRTTLLAAFATLTSPITLARVAATLGYGGWFMLSSEYTSPVTLWYSYGFYSARDVTIARQELLTARMVEAKRVSQKSWLDISLVVVGLVMFYLWWG